MTSRFAVLRKEFKEKHFRGVRSSVLFVIGVVILIIEIANALFRHTPFHSAILILGMTLCGVGVTRVKDSSLSENNGNGPKK